MMRRTLLALVLFAVPALAGAPVSTHILTTDKTVIGQPNDVPLHPTVIATMITFQPGDKTAVHKHPYPHYGYVLEGTLTIVNTETGKSFDVKTGEFLVEMVNTDHYGENRGKTPVKILIVDQVPEGMKTNSVVKD
jgi:quercetin dioxygenase-like cupin family protein